MACKMDTVLEVCISLQGRAGSFGSSSGIGGAGAPDNEPNRDLVEFIRKFVSLMDFQSLG
jgi:hypothetical protein